MKSILLFYLLIFELTLVQGQITNCGENIAITYEKGETGLYNNEQGKLVLNVTPQSAKKLKARGWVFYSDFGAKGDGQTDDIYAIAATHAFANANNLLVKADEDATYYIGGRECTVDIRTDTEFGTARFIIDDTDVENHNAPVFLVSSSLQHFVPKGITSIKKGQSKLNVVFPCKCVVSVTDANIKRYIRFGPNQNNGSSQTDVFIVDKNGDVDMSTPIIWDFDQITAISALPIDEKTLKIVGGHFTTIANQVQSQYNYYSRGFSIRRSNVEIDRLEHHVIGEGSHGAPYGGFINVEKCAYVTVKNTLLTGHKTYRTIGSAGVPVPMGSYDISLTRALNVLFLNCKQTNDINDNTYWGIMGSNFCKNLVYDGCVFSRFDAHMGVVNATVRNSTMGYMGINAIGSGKFIVENSTLKGKTFINLRSDYGSTWRGEFIIRNCRFVPTNGKNVTVSLLKGYNSGQHDFGYTCFMPQRIIIDSLYVDDSNLPEDYSGPTVFGDFNSEFTDNTYVEKYPYIITKEVILRNVETASGKKIRISANPYMFRNVTVNVE